MVQQKKMQKTWFGGNVQGKTSPARIIFHTIDSIWRLPMLQGSSIDHKQLGMIVLPKIFPMSKPRTVSPREVFWVAGDRIDSIWIQTSATETIMSPCHHDPTSSVDPRGRPSMLSTVPGPAPGRARAMEASEMLFINLRSWDFQPDWISMDQPSPPACRCEQQCAQMPKLYWKSPARQTLTWAIQEHLPVRYIVGSCYLAADNCGSLGSFAAKCLACAWWHASQGFLAGTTGTNARANIERGRSIQKYRNSLVSEIVSKKSLMPEVEGCKRPSHDRNFLPQEFRSAVNNCKDKSLIPAKQKVRNCTHHQSDMQNIGWNQAIVHNSPIL